MGPCEWSAKTFPGIFGALFGQRLCATSRTTTRTEITTRAAPNGAQGKGKAVPAMIPTRIAPTSRSSVRDLAACPPSPQRAA